MELDANVIDRVQNTESVWNEIMTAYQKNSLVKVSRFPTPLPLLQTTRSGVRRKRVAPASITTPCRLRRAASSTP